MAEDRETVTQDPIVISLKTRLQDRLGENLKELWLFGSRARGDADEDSDYDALVGSICFSPEAWVRSKRTPLGLNILKEGIRLL